MPAPHNTYFLTRLGARRMTAPIVLSEISTNKRAVKRRNKYIVFGEFHRYAHTTEDLFHFSWHLVKTKGQTMVNYLFSEG